MDEFFFLGGGRGGAKQHLDYNKNTSNHNEDE